MSWGGPFEIVEPRGSGPIVIVCDHASNALPDAIPDLGVSALDMQRHIAWDIGAAPIARHLARAFASPAILCGTSRLVIDCNRYLDDPTLIPRVSDGTMIPANQGLSEGQRQERIDRYFRPYHEACRDIIEAKCASNERPLFVAVHSMTERMNGQFRPWEISLSSNENRRATLPALMALRTLTGVAIGDNEPYNMDPLQDYSTPVHALARGLDYLQVEFRQDVVATRAGQERFAAFFAHAVRKALEHCSRP